MRDEDVDAALKDWAHWVTCGWRSDGFPRTNVLHKSWLPPTPGSTPALKVAVRDDGSHRLTHAAIGKLSMKLANTVVVHYGYRLSIADQCERLGCAPSTLHQRLRVARQRIGAEICALRNARRSIFRT